MKADSSLSTGSYSKKLAKRVSRIEKHARRNRIRRIILFFLMILVAVGGILYGISNKTNMQEEQYRQYAEMPERSSLTPELLSYKDTYDLFVQEYLGNDPAQSMMGGYFYDNGSYLIYPNKTATGTLVSIDGYEYKIADYLADQINVRGDYVAFRNPSSRDIFLYDLKAKKTSQVRICV